LCLYSATPLIKQTVIPAAETDLTYAQARSQVAEWKRRYPTMTVSLGLMPALPEDRGVQIVRESLFTDVDFVGDGEILLVQPTFSELKAPPTLSHYRLLASSFNTDEKVRIGPFAFKVHPWGWNFAVYLKRG